MNERIRELAEQAEDWADNQNFYESDYQDYLMEKFAELIVKECMKVCKPTVVVDNSYNDGRMSCISDLEKHFGVE